MLEVKTLNTNPSERGAPVEKVSKTNRKSGAKTRKILKKKKAPPMVLLRVEGEA